jgi:stage V sporulation protein R
MANITPELAKFRDEARDLAANYGLDFYEVIFELVDYDELNMIASYGGFPTRYPHWRFGMEYEQLSKSYAYGLSKIYELVINNDPCYAYLMRSNSLTDQKLVMAHVYGHCDFFKNNMWFARTSRKMMDVMANHATQVRRYMDKYGQDRVEGFIDRVTSIDNLIDVHSPYVTGDSLATRSGRDQGTTELPDSAPRHDSGAYMDRYINPRGLGLGRDANSEAAEGSVPEPGFRSTRDILQFLLEHAPLETWEQDILAMLREEAYYFAPQAMTKIMNEGWAVFWHSRIMTKHMLNASEIVSYADAHSGTLFAQPGQVNPYKMGVELFRHIEHRWNRGQFGAEYQRCEDANLRRSWDTDAGLGTEKVFDVRKIYNDVSFIDEFITPEFAEDQSLYVYGQNPETGQYEIVDRDYTKVKNGLLESLTNCGNPIIDLVDDNYQGRGEMYLCHQWVSRDLEFEAALRTLESLYAFWKKPVHLETCEDGKARLLSFDGTESTFKEISSSKAGAKQVVGSAKGPDDND